MQTKSQENLGLEAGASARVMKSPAVVEDTSADRASAGADPAPNLTTAPAPGVSSAPQSMPAPTANGGSPAAPSAAPSGGASSTPVASASPTSAATQAGHAAADDDAGTPHAQPHVPVSTAKQDQCNTDLALCLLDAPLNYDGCLRMAANNGCPMPDAGVPSTPVLDETGNPISQVCQAELAKCIMKLPTPENALACTEKARACK